MAAFYVGQRVRIVRAEKGHAEPGQEKCFQCLGKEATITGPLCLGRFGSGEVYQGYPINIDGIGERHKNGALICSPPDWLAPLTDPGAERFIESIKRMGYEEPKIKTPVKA